MTIEDFSLYILNKRKINHRLAERLVFYLKDDLNVSKTNFSLFFLNFFNFSLFSLFLS